MTQSQINTAKLDAAYVALDAATEALHKAQADYLAARQALRAARGTDSVKLYNAGNGARVTIPEND